MEGLERRQAWGPSSSSRPGCSEGEELKLCRCSWIGNPARYFCLCDTRDMVSLTEPQCSQRETGEAPAVLQGYQRVKEAALAQRQPLGGYWAARPHPPPGPRLCSVSESWHPLPDPAKWTPGTQSTCLQRPPEPLPGPRGRTWR